MKFKVGDKVKIINAGKIYSTYLKWVERNVKSKKLQNLFDVGNYYLGEHKNEIFTIKAKKNHGVFKTEMLYYIQNDETKKCYIIGEGGIKRVLVSKTKHFKSLPNDYTGIIEVKNGFIQEREILDEVEKRYLKAVIRPFKNRVKSVAKAESVFANKQFIKINLNVPSDWMTLPDFEKCSMYNGMLENKEYTLKELGLDE